MVTNRQQTRAAAAETARPIVEELGLELVDVELSGRGPDQSLCLYLDRPGGITVSELQEASRAVETALEVAEIVPGSFRLEVSSPGIDRPLKRPEDFARFIGGKVRLKAFAPLPDGSRQIRGVLVKAGDRGVEIDSDDGLRLALDYNNIASARPEIDWDHLLKRPAAQEGKASPARRTS